MNMPVNTDHVTPITLHEPASELRPGGELDDGKKAAKK
jgi:hypothetical protein